MLLRREIGGEFSEVVEVLRGGDGAEPLLGFFEREPSFGARALHSLRDALSFGVGSPDSAWRVAHTFDGSRHGRLRRRPMGVTSEYVHGGRSSVPVESP